MARGRGRGGVSATKSAEGPSTGCCAILFKTHLDVSNNVEQADDIRAPREAHEDLDLALDLLLLDRLEHLDDTL